MYKNPANRAAQILVNVLLVLGAVSIVVMPMFARTFTNFYGYEDELYAAFLAVLYSSGLCAEYILFNLHLMFKTLMNGNPFVESNVVCFKRMAAACAAASVIYIIKSVFIFSFGSVCVALVFTVGTMFCLTLKSIFEQAIAYKNENDLTI